MLSILTVLGTRPEAIKMAPVIKELEKHSLQVQSTVCLTAQHREMLDQVLDLFELEPDYDLNLMQERQDLGDLTSRIISSLTPVLHQSRPDWVLVQGDTTSVMAASLAAFYQKIKVGHVEAGLRTGNKRAPFPEEVHRRITSVIADIHFAPTECAHQALLREGIPDQVIHVTGNTVIDALLWTRDRVLERPPNLPDGLNSAIHDKRLLLVTGHRRESFGEGLEQICLALRELIRLHPDICLVYPVHLNPSVRATVYPILQGVDRVYLIEPLAYAPFVWLMTKSYLILTDSGGIQEEAPALGKPVLVLREVTERPEGIAAGTASLVGTNRVKIVEQVTDLLSNTELYQRMARATNPYGDGKAAQKVVKALLNS